MTITLARVDDRVIHGQTMTRWAASRKLDAFVIASDKVANDELRKKVLKSAANPHKLGIYDNKTAVEKIKMASESKKDFFVISDSPQNFAEILKMGGDFGKVLNIGPMNTRPGAKVLGRTTAIDQDDYDAFEYMHNHGIELQFQIIPEDSIRTWDQIKKLYDSAD